MDAGRTPTSYHFGVRDCRARPVVLFSGVNGEELLKPAWETTPMGGTTPGRRAAGCGV